MESTPLEGLSQIYEANKIFDTKQDAIQGIKAFWTTIAPDAFKDLTDEEYGYELTNGDRTIIRRGLPSKIEERGKWVVEFLGNHQPLSLRAEKYLKDVGIILEN